jgi:hypothetical protein
MSTISHKVNASILLLACALVFLLAGSQVALGAERPVKEILETQLGGFPYPNGVTAGPGPEHYVYVSDGSNGRIQMFTPTGAFVEMFGWDVNQTKTGEAGKTQQEKDICTEAEVKTLSVKCQAGQAVTGGPAGQIESATSLAVDQGTGDLYVWDNNPLYRVEKYTGTGGFLLMIGDGVNRKGGNTCTKAEESECQSGTRSATGSTVAGAFRPERGGDLLAVGANDTLYVGDEGRVQEFEHDTHLRDIPVSGRIQALALNAAGEVYVTGGTREGEYSPTIHKFAANGVEIVTKCTEVVITCWPLTLTPVHQDSPGQIEHVVSFSITALSADAAGRLAVAEDETFQEASGVVHTVDRGLLVNGASGEPITGVSLDARVDGFSFGTEEANGGYPLYAATEEPAQVLFFRPVSVAASSTAPAPCVEGGEVETNVSVTCTLNGEVNPWGVPHTAAWFAWGPTAGLGSLTPKRTVCSAVCGETPVPFGETVTGLRPGETIYYQVDAEDENVMTPEDAASKTATFKSLSVAPRIVGEPSVEFVRASSAVVFDEVNPENVSTNYSFIYGPCPSGLKGCTQSSVSQSEASGVYGLVGTTEELTGLQPGTTYHYALLAKNEAGQVTQGPEGTFTTGAAPLPSATTTAASQITSTGAVIAGIVDPNGQTASYALELGVYSGASTSYGVVASASIAAGKTPVAEQVALNGLQAGTTYAYRIKITNPYGEATGTTVTFTTAGLPSVLTVPGVLGQVAVPNIPVPQGPAKVTSKKVTRAQHLVRALKSCKKKRGKQRASCERNAHEKYGHKPKTKTGK